MPAAGTDQIPDPFDDDDTIAAQLNGQSEPEQELAFAPSAPPPKKSKKKNKKNAGKAQVKAQEGEDGPYGTSVTPPQQSPPKEEEGVKLGTESDKEQVKEEATERDENGVFEELVDTDTEPSRAPPPAAAARSPRPVPAKPVQVAARTPPSRPASLQSPPQHYSSLGGYRANVSPANAPPPLARRESPANPPLAARRESATRTSPRPRFVEPVAPPHKAQPHFYGLPDFGLNFGPQQKMDPTSSGKAAGSDGYCCTFDSFADSGDAVSGKKAKDALLVGSEGGLEVFRVLANKFEVVGRLEGLRGAVIGAKILPCVSRGDVALGLRPLVAVVVHGPMGEEEGGGAGEDEPPGYYQTTVEVYSLQLQDHVATLYRSAPVAVEKPTLGHLASVPGPVGDLSIVAAGEYAVVASGKSGEVFVFSRAATAVNPEEQFRCLGKFWTSLQTSPATAASRPQSSSDGGAGTEEKEEKAGVPLFSLSQRWLALVAPSTSSHVSIGGSPALLDDNISPPGIASHAAPPQPPISCDIAGVDAEGTWSRLTRQAAQGLVKYSHIGFEMGRQGWRELTNPAPQNATQHSRGASREHDAFPPTMAPVDDPSRAVKEPAIVSILDLDTLLEAEEVKPKYAPAPLSTFALQEGCNFLSLASNGLRLLSVSRSGKVSTIWDLAQSCHGVARHGVSSTDDDETAQGPCVKQLHRFERNSESRVVEAAWSRDDDMLAILTSHGTVHLHEIPSRRPSRKRKRRSTSAMAPSPAAAAAAAADKAQPTVSVSQGMSPPSTTNGGWMGSLKSGFQSVSTQVNTVRTQSSVTSFRPTFAGFRDLTANASQAGGRAIAKGLSQGYTAAKGGVGDYWHMEDNKIKHPALKDPDVAAAAAGGVLRWVRRAGGDGVFLAVVCGGMVHLHPVQHYTRRRGKEVVTGLRHERAGKKTFGLPLIKTAQEAASAGLQTQYGRKDVCAAAGVHGFWSLRTSPADDRRGRGVGGAAAGAPISPQQQANEVETSPPYCPFHVDPRVNIYAFHEDVESDAALFHLRGHGVEDAEEEPWIFGEALPASVMINTQDEDGFEAAAGIGAGMGEGDSEDEGLAEQMESRLLVGGEGEVRVHTRMRGRKGKGKGGEVDVEEGFEFEA